MYKHVCFFYNKGGNMRKLKTWREGLFYQRTVILAPRSVRTAFIPTVGGCEWKPPILLPGRPGLLPVFHDYS